MKLGISDFFRDVGNFLRGGAVLGIDIGSSAIKALELKKVGDKFSLKNYGLFETKDYLIHPNQAIQTSSLRISQNDIAPALRKLIYDMKPKTKLAIASIPSFVSFATTLDFPDLLPEETEKAITFQAAQYIPLPISKVSIEYRKVGEYRDNEDKLHQRILLVATPNDVLKSYKKIFKFAGLRLVALESEIFASARAIRGSLTDAPTLVVDIGAESTGIFIVQNKIVEYIGQTDYSGVYLTQALSRSLEISMTRAEELKKRRGLLGEGVESELSTILLPFLDVIIQEVRHVKDSYEKQFGKKLERFMLLGGGANLLGIEKYFSTRTNLMIGHHSFMSGIEYKKELLPVAKDIDNRFSVAYGCARRYFS